MQKNDSITRGWCISNETRYGTFLNSSSLTWLSKYVSVNGQSVVRTCQYGSLKHHKFQDIESEVEEQVDKWLAKHSSQRLCAVLTKDKDALNKGRPRAVVSTEKHKNQRDDKRKSEGGSRQKKLTHADGGFPCCMRQRKRWQWNKNKRKNEDSQGRGGGQQHQQQKRRQKQNENGNRLQRSVPLQNNKGNQRKWKNKR